MNIFHSKEILQKSNGKVYPYCSHVSTTIFQPFGAKWSK